MSNWLKLGGLTGISRVLGLARDIICANIFGASLDFDAFIVAFQIPNFMRRLFAEGALTQAFVPLYNELAPAQQKLFSGMVLGLVTLLTSLLVLTAWFAGKALIYLYAPGFINSGQLEMAVKLLHWTMPYIVAISIATLCAGIQNSHKQFILTGALPLILNLCLIAASMNASVLTLAKAVCLSGLIQASTMLFASIKHLGSITINFQDENMRKLLKLMLLGSLAAIIGQISTMLDTFLASWLEVGSVSWIYYAQRLVLLPVGIVAVAIATVALPELTRLKTLPEKFEQKLNQALSTVWQISWPAALGLMVLAPNIVGVFFHHGAFNTHSAVVTSNIVFVLALGLPAFMLNKVLIAACYAKKQMQDPIQALSISLVINAILGIILVASIQQIGIALASIIAAWSQTLLLSRKFNLNFIDKVAPFVAIIMAFVLLILLPKFSQTSNLLTIASLIPIGVISYELGLRCFQKSLTNILYD